MYNPPKQNYEILHRQGPLALSRHIFNQQPLVNLYQNDMNSIPTVPFQTGPETFPKPVKIQTGNQLGSFS